MLRGTLPGGQVSGGRVGKGSAGVAHRIHTLVVVLLGSLM